ncbi:MAG TPA: single-stranded-DNA-specific exonuclease RecJ [Chloroflexi bacterium]|nr:single-stranded-DNA-specific exonuclease RecJ [Chloroflexota bacterium]
MNKKWIEPQPVHVPESLRAIIDGRPLLAETLARRGFTDPKSAQAFLDPALYRPAPSTELPDAERAAGRIERAIRRGETICVWGDFDVDGQTSTTILVSALRDLGGDVRYHIPHRQRESHGVNLPVLKQILAEGAGVVMTCDTGVTAHEAIAYAQSQGTDVIVTDHHDLPAALPRAFSVTDPKMLPGDHPLRELPGVGVAYKLAQLLYERADRPADATQHLDLVALGIVADVATQVNDVRYLLQEGLEVLRRTERPGLQALIEIAELNPDHLTEEHIGFELAPRLNALGRLDDATVAVEFLMDTRNWTLTPSHARILATEIDGLNTQRKLLCNQVTQAALSQIERDPSLLGYAGLVLSHPSWPGGVIGIVAGRLAERFHKPTILLTTPEGEMARGSARSVEGCDIHAAIAAQQDMLGRFGGHPMAAGLSIEAERIPEFRRALSRAILEMCGDLEEAIPLYIDGYLPLEDVSLDLVDQLERLAPFGPGNPPLTLATRDVSLKSHTVIGRTREHVKLTVEDGAGTIRQVLWWRGAGQPLPQGPFDLAYTVRANDYRGQRQVQVEWVDARVTAPAVELRPTETRIRVVDYRLAPYPQKALEEIRQRGQILVWSEADHRAEVAGQDRRGLQPSEALAIWTTPPGPVELGAALEEVAPKVVYLFGVDPALDKLEPFLRRLGGIVKRAMNAEEGVAAISALAAAMAHRETSVRTGLAWLEAKGYVSVREDDTDVDRVYLEPAAPTSSNAANAARLQGRLKALLEETAAYRRYFVRADGETLVIS